MKVSVELELKFEAKPAERLFHRCQACGSEWPASTEYCRRCAVWLGSTCSTEDILWYVPASELPIGAKRNFLDGIYEATVLTVAACDNVYVNRSRCPELLLEAAKQMVASGGLIARGPGGHLAGCFARRDVIEAAKRAVQCAQAVQIESERFGIKTFMGGNTGPIVVRSQIDQESGKSHREISGGAIECSEALAFSLYPRMIVLSPATFKLVATRFECYGTEPINLWGKYPSRPKTVYIVAGSKKVTSWRDRLDDDSVPLVGREEELGLLCQHWEETESKEMSVGSAVHLVGEPGTGKSKLLQAFLAKVSRPGNDMNLIKLAGANYGGRSGLLLEEFVSECSRKGILSAKAARKMPRTGSKAPQSFIPKSLSAQVRLVSQLLAELKSSGPTLIVVDDVHWADRESIKVFGKAFSRLPARMMVIASYRPSGSGLAKLLTKTVTRQIILGPLDEDQAKQISKLQSKEEEWISRSAWHELWKKSQGNPLYVEEATKLLLTRRESSVGETRSDINPAGLALPGTRAGLLSARIQEWAEQELNELRQELGLQWGWSVSSRLASLETQVNDWLDRLETQGYLERAELAECLDELECFQNRVVEVCLVGGLSRPLTTRLREALSRLYEGSYEDHYQYLKRKSRVPNNQSWVGVQALHVARRAMSKGRLRDAVRFFGMGDKMLSQDHPLRWNLLDEAAEAHLLLGHGGEAVKWYERVLLERRIVNPHDDLAHRLLAARILNGEQTDVTSSVWEDDGCPWHFLLKALDAFLSKENEQCAFYAERAEKVSSDRVSRSSAWVIRALAQLGLGDLKEAVISCQHAAETMNTGGISLLSFMLHSILSQATEGPSRLRHTRAWKLIANQLGMTPGLRVLQSKFNVTLINDRRLSKRFIQL